MTSNIAPKSRTSAYIAQLEIHGFNSFQNLLEQIFSSNNGIKAGFAVAINPEKIILSKKDSSIHNILQKATIRYCDGIGVVKLLEYRSKTPIARLPGCELWENIMHRAAVSSTPVFILGGRNEVNQKTVDKLKNDMSVNVADSQDGFFDNNQMVIDRIISSKAKIVTVAMGSPRQEAFIVECMKQHPDCFYMGVGGTYDVFTGEQKRAPVFFRKNNLEWFYRLMKQPTRIGRHFRLVKFVYLALTNKI